MLETTYNTQIYNKIYHRILCTYLKDLTAKDEENWIRCTSWLKAGSRIIENNFRGCSFLFLAPAGGSNPAGPYPHPFLNLT